MFRTSTKTLALAAVVATAVACSGSSSGGSKATGGGSSSPAAGKTLTIGVLTDITGLAASGQKDFAEGVKAGGAVIAKDGYKFKYVVVDTQTSPQAALAGAQKLVQQDHA